MKNIKICLLVFFIAIAFTTQAQIVDTLNIPSKFFNQTRRVKVALPAGYNKYPNTEKKYMVAYLFDSQSDDFFNFFKQTISYLTANGYMQPVILVGISSANRQFEFTPKAQTPAGLKSFRKSGGADSLAMNLRDEVMPLIKSKYRCLPYQIGIGHSLGATFVTCSLLKYPELFNAAIAVSPNLRYDNEQIVHQFDSLGNNKILNHKFLYLAHGNGDDTEDAFKVGTEKVHDMLVQKNINGLRWQVNSMENDKHGTTPMEGVFKGLIALNKQFTITDAQLKDFSTDKNKPFIESVKDYYQSLSEWAGILLPDVDVINSMGYNLFYVKDYKNAIAVFNWGLSVYPKNVNLYDSMGEIQQNSGDKATALIFYNKGMDVVKAQKLTLDIATYNQLIHGFESRIKHVND